MTLHKGQTETVKFKQPLKGGGRLAIFARGAEVSCSAFGDLTGDQVAEMLGKSRGAVKALQRRAVAALRRRLEEAPS